MSSIEFAYICISFMWTFHNIGSAKLQMRSENIGEVKCIYLMIEFQEIRIFICEVYLYVIHILHNKIPFNSIPVLQYHDRVFPENH